MPFYVYRCPVCTREITEHLPMERRNDPVICLGCGREMRRQISVPAVQFRGSGFYVTDSRPSGDTQ